MNHYSEELDDSDADRRSGVSRDRFRSPAGSTEAQRGVAFIGRERERGQLRSLVAAAASGVASVVVVSGESGIGKTALVDVAVADARADRDCLVLATVGIEGDAAIAFGGLLSLLRPCVDEFEDLPAFVASTLRGALGLGPPVATDRFSVGAALLQLFGWLAERRLLIVTIDDLQWIDAASRDALFFAISRLRDDAIAVLITARSDLWSVASGTDARELRRWGGRRWPVIQLGGLSVDDSTTLLTTAGVSVTAAPSVAALCHGNPLVLIEAGSRLTPRQRLGLAPVNEHVSIGQVSAQMFRAPLEQLDAAQRFDLLLAACSDGDRVLLNVACPPERWAPLEAERFVVVHPSRIEFVHPLVRSAVIGLSTAPERRRAFALLGAAAAPLDEIRSLWFRSQAADGPDDRLSEALLRRAAQQLAQGDPVTAARSANRAAELATTRERAAPMHLLAAHASLAAGIDHGSHVAEVLASGLPVLEAEARVIQAAAATWHGDAANLDLLRRSVLPTLASSHPDAAAIVAGFCAAHRWNRLDIAGADSLGAQSWELAQRRVDIAHPLGLLPAISRVVYRDFHDGDPLDAPDFEVVASEIESRAVVDLGILVVLVRMVRGQHREGEAFAERMYEIAVKGGSGVAAAWLAVVASMASQRLGLLDDALRWASQADELASVITGGEAAQAEALAQLAIVSAMRGEYDSAHRRIDEVRVLAGSVSVGPSIVSVTYAEVLIAQLSGDVERAIELCSEPLVSGAGATEMFPFVYELIECLVRSGRDTEARAVHDGLGEIRAHPSLAHRGQVLRCVGLLTDDFEVPLREAIAEFDRLGRNIDGARAELTLGERLRRSGRPTDARPVLRSALTTFESAGCAPWALRARIELRASGGFVKSPDNNGDAMTPQERSVALAVVDGRTNREIAASLFLSPRSVEGHLTRIYRKLGVRSRAELITRLHETT